MGSSTIIARLRNLGLWPTQEQLAAYKEEQVEVFLGLFQNKTTHELIAIIQNRFYVEAAREAAHLLIHKRERLNE